MKMRNRVMIVPWLAGLMLGAAGLQRHHRTIYDHAGRPDRLREPDHQALRAG